MDYIYRKVNLKTDSASVEAVMEALTANKANNNPKALCTNVNCWFFLTSYQRKNHSFHQDYIVTAAKFSSINELIVLARTANKIKGDTLYIPSEKPFASPNTPNQQQNSSDTEIERAPDYGYTKSNRSKSEKRTNIANNTDIMSIINKAKEKDNKVKLNSYNVKAIQDPITTKVI